MSQNIKKIANEHVNKTYGNLIQLDDPLYLVSDELWNVNLKCLYPKIIVDDNIPPNRELYFVTFSNLGTVKVNKNMEIVYHTSRKEVLNNIDNNENIYNDRLEKIIIKASSSNLVFTPTVQHFLNPLRRILSTILLTGKITSDEIRVFPNIDRAHEWIYLLEQSEIIKKTKRGYEYDSMWTMLLDESNNIHKNFITKIEKTFRLPRDKDTLLLNLIMSYILEEHFSYIREVMQLKGISRILNVNSIYYRPCINSEKTLKFKPNTILYEYNKRYTKLQFPLISSTITELMSVGLLNYNDGLLNGSDIHLNAMMKLEPAKQISLQAV